MVNQLSVGLRGRWTGRLTFAIVGAPHGGHGGAAVGAGAAVLGLAPFLEPLGGASKSLDRLHRGLDKAAGGQVVLLGWERFLLRLVIHPLACLDRSCAVP